VNKGEAQKERFFRKLFDMETNQFQKAFLWMVFETCTEAQKTLKISSF